MSKRIEREEEEEDEGTDSEDDKKEQKKRKQPKFVSKNVSKQPSTTKITINISGKQKVKQTVMARALKWKVQTDPQGTEWDIWWTDNAVQPQTLFRMGHHQKINHFPGMYTLARKNLLGKGLMKMKKEFPQQYNFFPLTWMLPSEYSEFRLYFESKPKGKSRTYIVKPEALSQGKGIFLTRKLEDLVPGEHYVVQRYLHKPYLIEGLKFDFRIYVLLAGVDPLRVYLYNEGLARFATQPYIIPTKQNMEDVCMHLTNYAINKDNPNFVFNQSQKDMSIGHKRSLTSVFELLEKQGLDVPQLKQKIKDILIKTFISGLPLIRHQYRSCQLENYAGNMCFQVLGFDVILTSKGDPYLLEVNHTPSFTTDTPLDEFIKKNLITDSLVLMNINATSKAQIMNIKKQQISNRVITGKKVKLTQQQRDALRVQAQKQRDIYEDQHLGGFQKIFPIDDQQKMQLYATYLEHSEKIYEESTGIKKKTKDKPVEKILQKANSINQQPKNKVRAVNKSQREPPKPPSKGEPQDTRLMKEDGGFLPIIQHSESPTNRQGTPASIGSIRADRINQKPDDNQRQSGRSLHSEILNLKLARQANSQREIMESLNKNYAQYMYLKEGLKKKISVEEKNQPEPPKEDNRQYINQAKVDSTADRKRTVEAKKKLEKSQTNQRNTQFRAMSLQRQNRPPLSLNTLLQAGPPDSSQAGTVSISNLKQLLNRRRQNG